jgi:hypothetical protein
VLEVKPLAELALELTLPNPVAAVSLAPDEVESS